MAAVGQGEGQQTQGEGGEETQGASFDPQQLATQLGQQGETLEQMRQFLASNPWAAQQAQENGDAAQQQQTAAGDFDLSYLDDQALSPEQLQAKLADAINGAVDQRAQALVAPIAQQQAELRRDAEARDLAAEFPELATPEMANKIAGQGGLAHQLAESLGTPQLANEPKMWRVAYMMHKAAESANAGQGSGDPGAAQLESGNGAGPGQTPADLKQSIMNAGHGRGSSVLNFKN